MIQAGGPGEQLCGYNGWRRNYRSGNLRSLCWGADIGAATPQAVGLGNLSISNWHAPPVPDMEGYIYFDSKSGFKLTSSFFVSSKLFIWKDVLEGKQRQTLKCLALSSAQGYFMHFLKGMLAPWHACWAAHSAHSAKIAFWSLWLQFTWKTDPNAHWRMSEQKCP